MRSSLMGAGTLALQVSFVYTHHFYYYRPIQHMIVPRVTQENTNVEMLEYLNYRTWVQYKSKTGGYELRPPVSNA